MRRLFVLPVLLAASCTPQKSSTGNDSAPAMPASSATIAAIPPVPATSPDALAAKRTVERYFALVVQKKYAEARKLWDHDGADSGGDAAALAKSYTVFTTYAPKVGDPTEIKTVGWEQYVAVAVKVQVKEKRSGREYEREGPVLLRRQVTRKTGATSPGLWHIWGIDIRRKH
jgi:hypothetical protein